MLLRFVPVLDTILRRGKRLPAVFEGVEQAGVPNFVWLKRDFKTEPAVGRNSLTRSTHHRSCHCAAKIPVRIHRANLLPLVRPFSSDLAAAYNMTRLNFKDVGKVASKGHLKLETHWLHVVVSDVEIFVQASTERSADGKAESARRDLAVFGDIQLVGEKDQRCVIVNGTAVQ